MAGDKFWHCLLSNIWPLIGQTGPYSGFAFYWLWDHIFDFIGRQAEIDFGRIYEVALLFSTFPPITDNPDSEISWSQPMRWGKISRQEYGVYFQLLQPPALQLLHRLHPQSLQLLPSSPSTSTLSPPPPQPAHSKWNEVLWRLQLISGTDNI